LAAATRTLRFGDGAADLGEAGLGAADAFLQLAGVQGDENLPLPNAVSHLHAHLLHVAHHLAGNGAGGAGPNRARSLIDGRPIPIRGGRDLDRDRSRGRGCGVPRRFVPAGGQQHEGTPKRRHECRRGTLKRAPQRGAGTRACRAEIRLGTLDGNETTQRFHQFSTSESAERRPAAYSSMVAATRWSCTAAKRRVRLSSNAVSFCSNSVTLVMPAS
jgi:hypothetical protein